jgi:hypothetical protein
LQEAGHEQEEAREPEIVSPNLIRRASGKIFRVPSGHRYQEHKEMCQEKLVFFLAAMADDELERADRDEK